VTPELQIYRAARASVTRDLDKTVSLMRNDIFRRAKNVFWNSQQMTRFENVDVHVHNRVFYAAMRALEGKP
jgi:hypothetical protein